MKKPESAWKHLKSFFGYSMCPNRNPHTLISHNFKTMTLSTSGGACGTWHQDVCGGSFGSCMCLGWGLHGLEFFRLIGLRAKELGWAVDLSSSFFDVPQAAPGQFSWCGRAQCSAGIAIAMRGCAWSRVWIGGACQVGSTWMPGPKVSQKNIVTGRSMLPISGFDVLADRCSRIGPVRGHTAHFELAQYSNELRSCRSNISDNCMTSGDFRPDHHVHPCSGYQIWVWLGLRLGSVIHCCVQAECKPAVWPIAGPDRSCLWECGRRTDKRIQIVRFPQAPDINAK